LDGLSGVPYLNYAQIRNLADRFLRQHHPSGSLPVPIEEIVESKLGINIVPLAGLQQGFDIVGFISSDLTEISVDQYIYESRERRYRFTLAHEVGHVVLHRELFQGYEFNTTDEWNEFVRSIPNLENKWLEWQAHCFAGLVLVPKHALERELGIGSRRLRARGVKMESQFARDLLVDITATKFNVSPGVIERRVKYDEIELADYLK
jgi:Zn-dependent peptidase ImmA (M78 family)